jgi:hypothetical protein
LTLDALIKLSTVFTIIDLAQDALSTEIWQEAWIIAGLANFVRGANLTISVTIVASIKSVIEISDIAAR